MDLHQRHQVNFWCRLLFHHFAQHIYYTCVCEFLLIFPPLVLYLTLLSFLIGGASTSYVHAVPRLLSDLVL